MLDKVGKWFTTVLEELGETFLLFVETVRTLFASGFKTRLVLEQMSRIGVDSLPVALTTALAVGMVFAIQVSGEFVKFGAGKVVGGVMVIAVARELAPALTGVVVAARVGAAMAAEIGTMKVTQQVDALYALGSSPVKYLVLPRFIATTLMLPLLTILADLVGFIGAFFVATTFSGINSIDFMSSAEAFLGFDDIFGGIVKTIIFGMLVSIIACYKGLKAQNGAKGVGEATTLAVVHSLIAIFVFNYFLSVLFFQ